MMKRVLAVLSLLLINFTASAQCAMCKATAESNMNGGDSMAAGLNVGIIYLMFIPYLLIGGIAFAIYRHRKKAAADKTA